MSKPYFELTRIYDDGSREPPKIIPLGDPPLNESVGRRALFGVGLDAAKILREIDTNRSRAASPAVILYAHEKPITGLAVTPDGRFLISSAGDITVKFWDLGGRLLFTENKTTAGPGAVAISPDGTLAVVSSFGKGLLYSLSTGARTSSATAKSAATLEVTRDGRTQVISGVIEAGPLLKPTVQGEIAAGPSVAFSPAGKLLASGGGGVSLIAIEERREVRGLGRGNRFAFSADGKRIAAGARFEVGFGLDPSINARVQLSVWSLAEPDKPLVINAPAEISSLVFTPDGSMLITCHLDATIRVWNPADGKLIGALSGAPTAANAIGITSNGKTLVTGHPDRTLKIWNLQTMRLDFTLTGHPGAVKELVLTQDDRFVVSGDANGVIIVWDLATRDFASYMFDPGLHIITAQTYSARDQVTGQLRYFSVPCSTPIPAGATCVCNCVAGTKPFAGGAAPPPTGGGGGGGGGGCACNLICVCNLICTCNLVFR